MFYLISILLVMVILCIYMMLEPDYRPKNLDDFFAIAFMIVIAPITLAAMIVVAVVILTAFLALVLTALFFDLLNKLTEKTP